MGHIRRKMAGVPRGSNVLAGPPNKCPRYVRGLVRIARVLGEVGWARSSSCAVDRRQQNQISPGVVNLPTPQCQTILGVIEPESAAKHLPQEALPGNPDGITRAAVAAGVLPSHVPGRSRPP